MTAQAIPVSRDLAFYRQTTTLDGRDYILTFRYNAREDRWYIDLADQDDVEIVSGLKLVCAHDLLLRIVDERRPPGRLMVHDGAASDPATSVKIDAEDPGFDELGDTVVLLYVPEADLA